MSIEFEPIHVRPMTETPDTPFRYVNKEGEITRFYAPMSFDASDSEQVGWIPANFTPKPPQPKDGEWWMCRNEIERFEMPLLLQAGQWCGTTRGIEHACYEQVTPLYKMEMAKE